MLAVLTDAVRCFRMGSASWARTSPQTIRRCRVVAFPREGNGPFSVQTSVMRSKSIPAGSDAGLLHWRDRELAGEASRMIRRPPVLPVKQASGSAFDVSSRKK